MNTELMQPYEIIALYEYDAKKLFRYLPWLEEKSGKNVSKMYNDGDVGKSTVSFPVYDSTLLSFVREVENTMFFDRNYPYVYSRYKLRTPEDELHFIENATIQQMHDLGGILSYYVSKGKVKGRMWSAAVENGVFVAAVGKVKELIDYWLSIMPGNAINERDKE